MQKNQNAVEFKKINVRLDRIEQILPTLATKDDLKGFATKDDLKGFLTKADIKGMPTQEDPKGFVTKDDLKGFPTQDDPKGFVTTADLKAESQETRRFMMVLCESLKADICLVAEGLADMNRALLAHDHLDIRAGLARLDLRILNLETQKRRRPRVS